VPEHWARAVIDGHSPSVNQAQRPGCDHQPMRFTMVYEGQLPPTQRKVSPIKARLREAFSPQVEEQLRSRVKTFEHLDSQVGGHNFVCVVNDRFRTGAELEVLILTPTDLARPGDIDNRLKTLIDGLTRPANSQQLQDTAPNGETTFCLLEDDGLITKLAVDSRSWLGRPAGSNDVLVLVSANIVNNGVPTFGGSALSS
jgi:hypothetical protein